MTAKRHSFTIKSRSRLRRLVTPVYVSVASKHSGDAARSLPSRQFESLWDTGATISVVSEHVVDALRLASEGYITVGHAGGESHDVPIYYANILLYNNVLVENLRVGLLQARDLDVIVGMDIINRGDFAVSNKNGATSFSFRIPSVEDFDFAAQDNI